MARRTYPSGTVPLDLRGLRYLTLRYYVTLDVTPLQVPEGVDVEADVAANIAGKMIAAAQAQLVKEAKRPESHTGRLSKAIDDPRGKEIAGNKIQLFKASFLDEYVPYWRAIDQGSDLAVRQRRLLTGLFTSGGELTPFPNVPARYGRAGLSTSSGPGRRDQRLFRPGATSRVGPRRSATAATRARKLLQEAGYPNRFASRVSGLVRNPIKPEHYIRAAREAFHREDAQKLAQEYLAGLFPDR